MAEPPRKRTTGNAPRPPEGASGAPGASNSNPNPNADESRLPTRAAAPVRGSPPRQPAMAGSGSSPAQRPSPARGNERGGARNPEKRSPDRGADRGGERGTVRQSPVAGERRAAAPANRESGREAAPADAGGPVRRGAAHIGSLRRQGLGLALKISLAVVLLVSSAMLLFGWVASSTTETRLRNEIVNSGYGQLLALRGFAGKVMKEFQGERNERELNVKLLEYREKRGEADRAFVLQLLEHEKRVYDVAIFASYYPTPNPSLPVLQGRAARGFADPAKSVHLAVSEPHADPEVLVYEGPYRISEGGVDRTERCLYFRAPIREGPSDAHPELMFASLNLILSQKEIADEVSALRAKLLLIGTVVAAAAVGIGLLLSRLTTRPIRDLVADMNEVAHGNFEHQSLVANSSRDEIGLLASAFNQMTLSLQQGRESERENQRISGELNTAKAIHIKLMPEKLPQLPGIDIFTAYQSAKEVGGDYYDFIPVGDAAHLALCVADVSGKGIPGSMVMGTTRTILRMMAVNNLSASDVLDRTNFHVARDIKRGMFVTCVYCILNVRTHEMTVASAGHNPLLWYHAATGRIDKVRPNGIALGFDKGPIFKRTIREERLKLEKGDRVVLYTDGVVEAMNEEREEFSDEALEEFTLRHATLPSREFVRLLIAALEEHKGAAEQHDDITITTFRIV